MPVASASTVLTHGVILTLALSRALPAEAFQVAFRATARPPSAVLHLYYQNDSYGAEVGGSDRREDSFLSPQDRLLLQSLKARQITLPVMVVDPLLPGQTVTLQSSDPAVLDIVQESCIGDERKIGVVGHHPSTQQPLSHGVVAKVQNVVISRTTSQVPLVAVTLAATEARLQIQKSWQQGRISMAACELLNGRHEVLTSAQLSDAAILAKRLKKLVRQWCHAAVDAKITTAEFLRTVLEELDFDNIKDDLLLVEISSKQDAWTSLAMKTTALLNPVQGWNGANKNTRNNVCMEIRPAMLSTTNPLERLMLAVAALENSLELLKQLQ